ncbi:MAG: ATP-binding cassette domain-containing protein [bacterium]|nr:ATP-binding cassette domain-containing protein [bacterium]
MSIISLKNVDIIFGSNAKIVLPLLDRGDALESIQQNTNHVVAVRNVTLSVERGEVFVLMGLSGSGKSSLARCMNGLNKVSRGKIKVSDISVGDCNSKTLRALRREHVSMVFQKFNLLPWRTVEQNVALGLELQGLSLKIKDDKVSSSLELVGLTPWKKYYPAQLSGGMQQRVGLARALSTGAEILLMDEPFSALDPVIRTELQNELLRLQDELKKTIVFVSHDLKEALRIGNKIAIMRSGEIVQVGTPEDISANPADDYVKRFVANA